MSVGEKARLTIPAALGCVFFFSLSLGAQGTKAIFTRACYIWWSSMQKKCRVARNDSTALVYDAFGLIGITVIELIELDWKTLIFFERAAPMSKRMVGTAPRACRTSSRVARR